MYWKVMGTLRLLYRVECGCEFCEGHDTWLRKENQIVILTDDDVELTRLRSIQWREEDDSEETWVLRAAVDYLLATTPNVTIIGWQDAERFDWEPVTVRECGEAEVMYLMGYAGLFDIPGLPSTGAALPSTAEVR